MGTYKNLKARSQGKRDRNLNRGQRLGNTRQKLAGPRKQPQASGTQGNQNYEQMLNKLQKSFDNKIQAMQKDYTSKLEASAEQSRNSIKSLGEQVEQSGNGLQELDDSMRKALKNVYDSRQPVTAKPPADKTEQGVTADTKQWPEIPEYGNDSLSIDDEVAVAKSAEGLDKEDKEAIQAGVAKDIKDEELSPLKLRGDVKVGDYSFKITNLYGPRTGTNAVAGREDGEHSRGVDFVSYNSEGKKINLPVSVLDGTIINIQLQGNGKAITTKQGKAAGYYMDIRSAKNPNKVIRYAHLDPGVMRDRMSLIGSNVKRGDLLYDKGKFTGSGTGPHIKLFMSDINEDGVVERNYTSEGNDPSKIIQRGFKEA